MAKEKKSFMNRLIDIIEKGGNKLPHPFILFGILLVAVLILSFVFSQLGTSITYYSASKTVGAAGKEVTVKVVNLLSADNFRYLITQYPDIYVGYTPLKLTLIMMATTAFIDKTGFFESLMKNTC
nr:AbgT family transporter [uncultured Acidaminococcus sp.]